MSTAKNPVAPLSPSQIRLAVRRFTIASDQTRLSILSLLSEGEANVTAICEHLKQTQTAVSRHLALLKITGVLESRREGKHNYYSLGESGRLLVRLAAGLSEDN